jgi:hypothetical protein
MYGSEILWHTFSTAELLLLQQEMLHCGYWPQRGVALTGYWKAVEYKLKEMPMRSFPLSCGSKQHFVGGGVAGEGIGNKATLQCAVACWPTRRFYPSCPQHGLVPGSAVFTRNNTRSSLEETDKNYALPTHEYNLYSQI